MSDIEAEGHHTNPDDPAQRVGITVSFTSKDPMLTKHYRDTFGSVLRQKFTEVVEQAQAMMAEHAAAQEHWDYDVVEGRRIPRRDENGTALLLVPKVRVSIQIGADRE